MPTTARLGRPHRKPPTTARLGHPRRKPSATLRETPTNPPSRNPPATTPDASQAVTTSDALNIIPASTGILTVDIGDDGTRMHIMDAINDVLAAEGASWYDFDEVQVTGDPSLIDMSGFLSQYTDSDKTGPSLDLSNVEEVWKLIRTVSIDSYISSIVLPDTVTTLYNQAFLNCSALTKAVMMDGVTTLESDAFGNCSSLAQVTLPKSVTTIGESAFEGCTALTTITIPNRVISIGRKAFAKCENLSRIMLDHENSAMTSIGDQAFSGCGSLKNIILPEGLDTLGTDLFLPDPYGNPNPPVMHLRNVYFTGTKPPRWQNSFEQVFNTQTTPELLLYYPEENADSYTPTLGPWDPDDANGKSLPYSLVELPPTVLSGLKPSDDGAPPTYEIWETPEFQVNVSTSINGANATASRYRVAQPSKWELHAQTADGPVVAAGTWAPESTRFHAAIYPAPPRPVGVCQLVVDSNVQIKVPGRNQWRDFPRELGGSADTEVPIEFLPPHDPAEASWLLIVQNGTGGGYYEAEHSAPIVAELTATPPAPDAKFLRWELVSGTGTFVNTSSPSTRFTMAVGNSTIRAVFDMGAAAPPPIPTPIPTPSPATGDSADGLPAAALLLLAAGMAVAVRRKRND